MRQRKFLFKPLRTNRIISDYLTEVYRNEFGIDVDCSLQHYCLKLVVYDYQKIPEIDELVLTILMLLGKLGSILPIIVQPHMKSRSEHYRDTITLRHFRYTYRLAGQKVNRLTMLAHVNSNVKFKFTCCNEPRWHHHFGSTLLVYIGCCEASMIQGDWVECSHCFIPCSVILKSKFAHSYQRQWTICDDTTSVGIRIGNTVHLI